MYWIRRPESGLQEPVVKTAGSVFPRLYVSKSGVPERNLSEAGNHGQTFHLENGPPQGETN
jgi:hypothetical protein